MYLLPRSFYFTIHLLLLYIFSDGAHVEFFRGLANPIAVKLSGVITPTELVLLVRYLNPNNEAWKLTLITRYAYMFHELN